LLWPVKERPRDLGESASLEGEASAKPSREEVDETHRDARGFSSCARTSPSFVLGQGYNRPIPIGQEFGSVTSDTTGSYSGGDLGTPPAY